MSESKYTVLATMQLLGATNAEQSAYENVEGGKEAWDELVAEGHIVREGGFWVLSHSAAGKPSEP